MNSVLQSIHLHLSDEKLASLAASLMFLSPARKPASNKPPQQSLNSSHLSQSTLSQHMQEPFIFPAKSNYVTVHKLFVLEIDSVTIEVISDNLLSPLVAINILGAKAEFQERPYDRSVSFVVSEFSVLDCTQGAESSSRYLASTKMGDGHGQESAFINIAIAQFMQAPPKLVC